MKLILIPLFILILTSISVQMFNFQSPDFTGEGNTNLPSQSSQLTDLGISNTSFTVTVMGGFIILFTTIAGVGIISGLNISVFGSTVQISQRAQNILYNALFYGGLWGIFSVLASTGISGLGIFSVPIFGALFYLILSLIYVLGINQQIEKGD